MASQKRSIYNHLLTIAKDRAIANQIFDPCNRVWKERRNALLREGGRGAKNIAQRLFSQYLEDPAVLVDMPKPQARNKFDIPESKKLQMSLLMLAALS